MSRLIAVLPRFAAGTALTVALVLAPTVLPSGGDNAEARTKDQCRGRNFGCLLRCNNRALEKYGKGGIATTKSDKETDACAQRTCNPQYKSCVDNASDTKKPTKAVAEPSGAGPKTKVQPKGQPGKVNLPDKVGPVTRVPPKVQPMGGVQPRPGSGGPILRKGK